MRGGKRGGNGGGRGVQYLPIFLEARGAVTFDVWDVFLVSFKNGGGEMMVLGALV